MLLVTVRTLLRSRIARPPPSAPERLRVAVLRMNLTIAVPSPRSLPIPLADSGGQVRGDGAVTHHEVRVADPDACAGAGDFPAPDRQPLEYDFDQTRSGARHVEDPIELLPVDDRCAAPVPWIVTAPVMSKSPVRLASSPTPVRAIL